MSLHTGEQTPGLPTLEDEDKKKITNEEVKSPPDESPTSEATTEQGLVIYGRNSCGFTSKYRKELKQANIEFIYKDIDNPANDKEFTKLMINAGLNSVDLPVVIDKGKMSIRPNLVSLIKNNMSKGTDTEAYSQTKTVIVYSISSSSSKQFLGDLNEYGVKFTFKDVNSPAIEKEFSKRMIAAGFSGSVKLPIVLIDNKIYVQPSAVETMQKAK